jgi:Flp pilus assembly protein TadG
LAAVEFAVILPLLVTLVLGCIDFGRFPHTYMAVTNAARAGAWTGIIRSYSVATWPALQTAVRQAVEEEMANLGNYDASLLTVTTTTTVDSDGARRLSVEVGYTFRTLITWPGIPATMNLKRVVVLPFIR